MKRGEYMTYEIRKMLSDIVGVAYADSNPDTLAKYQSFFLELSEKDAKSYGGYYTFKDKKIRIVGWKGKTARELIRVCIHELAHHIETRDTGRSGHGSAFYVAYEKLLFAALDMGILSVEEIKRVSDETNYTDNNKVLKILSKYVPNKVSYKDDVKKIHTYNSYAIKDILKSRGYKFSSADNSWYKEITDVVSEKEFLLSYLSEKDIQIVDGAKIHKREKHEIIVCGNTYNHKDVLKQRGYRATKDGALWLWKKEIPEEVFSLGKKAMQKYLNTEKQKLNDNNLEFHMK